MRKLALANKLEDTIEILKLQRDILKDGGYGRSVRTPRKEERLLRDSVTCLHAGEARKRGSCDECVLADFVPPEHRDEEYPGHFIPLNERGDTIHSLEEAGEREKAEIALLGWLNSTIKRLEKELAKQRAGPVESKAGKRRS